MKRYIFKNYGNSYLNNYLRSNQNEDGSRKKSIGITSIQNTKVYNLTIPRLYDLSTSAI